ncbi:MAG: uracil-DNA glycosylase family protein [Bacteroidaceae bacterium]|nr:uracil-DNA glycosylase family protein [Bacteroidaceae bacterium]
MTFEDHPLQPFLPAEGRVLFLGSFPPPRARWSMDFFYPNFINDFWRIMGLLHFSDAQHFVVPGEKRFDRERIVAFCHERGLAFYDTARRVCRLKDNASDDHLEIVAPSDIASLLRPMPSCHDIVTTGGKASEALQAQLGFPLPPIGEYAEGEAFGRSLRWWRMPSSSRAYPLKLEKKADFYARLFLS